MAPGSHRPYSRCRPELRPKHSITLVNRNSTSLYSGMVPGLMAGIYQRDELAIDLRDLCERARVAFVQAEITSLDPEQNRLHLRDRPELHFHWLSLDVGAVSRPNATGIPIKPLEASLAFLENEDPRHPNPPKEGSGSPHHARLNAGGRGRPAGRGRMPQRLARRHR